MTGGDCFEAAARLLVFPSDAGRELAAQGGELVHGIVRGSGPLEGIRFTHAWVEVPDSSGVVMVYDYANGQEAVIPAALYYLLGGIDPAETVRYSAGEARRRLIEYKHYGPWEGSPAAHADPEFAAIADSL